MNRHLFFSKTLFILLLTVICVSTHAQTNWNFAAPTDGSGNPSAETGKGICTDASGNVYMAGVFNGASDFDLNAASTSIVTSSTGNDGFIASYDKNGNFRWKTIVSGFGSDFNSFQTGLCTNGTDVWVAGSVNVTTGNNPAITGNGITTPITGLGATNGVDALVAKMSCSTGAVSWVKTFGSIGTDAAQGITVDPTGCVYVIGDYNGSFTLDAVTAPVTTGSSDMFIAKFGSDGRMIHFAKGGTSNTDMQVNGGGICYVPGATPAIVAVGSQNLGAATYGSLTLTNQASTLTQDGVLLEIDTTLSNFTNALIIGSTDNSADELIGAVYDPFSGDVYVCGYFNSSSVALSGAGTLINSGAVNTADWLVARYSVSGNNFTWAKSATGTGIERAWSVAADGQGGIIVAGSSASASCAFGGSVSLTPSAGLNDIVVVRYSTSGTPIWGLTAGGTSTDDARSVACYVQSVPYTQSIYITGNVQASVNFNGTTLVTDGGNDFFLARINDASVPLSATQSQVNLTCNGICTGSATVVASGGTAPYTYSWSPSGGSGATASSLCATTYWCTITDNVGTSIIKTFTLTQPPAIITTPISQTNVACFGGSNGAASMTASGGTGTLTYNWTPGNPTGDGTASVTGLTANTWTCTVTDANSCTATRNFTITQPTVISTSTTSQTNVSCFGGSNGAATISASGGVGGFTYNWTPGNPTGDGTVSVSGLTANTWSCTVTDANSCTAVRNVTITQPTAIASSVSSSAAACSGINNGTATISSSGGTGSHTYAWSPSGGTAATAINLSSGSYTVTITDANSCTATQGVTITASSATQTGALAGTAGGGVTTQTQNVGNASGYYTDGSCNNISRVQASGATPVSGNVTTKVWIESAVPGYLTHPFVARHYEITPAVGASTATGTVTLYFLQSEFNAYNAVAGSLAKLPTGAGDATGIANIRIDKYPGTSSDNSGLPATYTGGDILIDPVDANVIWNATAGRWEITFNVSGFSGFMIHTSSFTLPVSLVAFTAEKQADKVILKWQTASETNSDHFIVQYSADGNSFAAIGTMAAAGNSNSLHNYSFTHAQPRNGNNYYRLLSVDIDGRQHYSDIRRIEFSDKQHGFSILENPVSNGQLQVQFYEPTTALIYNSNGQVIWKQSRIPGSQAIDVSKMAKGVYWLKAGGNVKKFLIAGL